MLSTPSSSFWLTFLFFCVQFYFFPIYQHFLFFLSVFPASSAVFRLLCRFFTLFLPFFSFSSIFSLLLMSLSQAHFLRFAPLKMFHVKHRFSRFSVFSGQWETICFFSFWKSPSFLVLLIFKIIVFFILFSIFAAFSTFSLCFRVFHAVFLFYFRSFIKLLNYIFILSYKLNFYIRFFGFSKAFTKRIFSLIFPGFSLLRQGLSIDPVFALFCVSFHHFFAAFPQLCKPV